MKRLLERAWVNRILSGDEVAGERFVTHYYPRIRAFLRHLTLSEDAAADLTQQTFVEAWSSLSRFRGDSSLNTWLHRIAYFQHSHWSRSRRPHGLLDEDFVPDPASKRALEGIHLRDALSRLSPEHREPILLRYSQGLSVNEVAVVLDLPPGTVKSRLHAARQRLRVLLSEFEQPEKEVCHNAPTLP